MSLFDLSFNHFSQWKSTFILRVTFSPQFFYFQCTFYLIFDNLLLHCVVTFFLQPLYMGMIKMNTYQMLEEYCNIVCGFVGILEATIVTNQVGFQNYFFF